MDDLISRQAAIERLREYANDDMTSMEKAIGADYCMDLIRTMPSAQPDQRWIPIKTRPMTEEESNDWSEILEYDIEYEDSLIYVSQLPDDGQEVLTCSRYGWIRIDKFENDPDYGCSFEENGDMDGIVAWMPMPEPYKGGEHGRSN